MARLLLWRRISRLLRLPLWGLLELARLLLLRLLRRSVNRLLGLTLLLLCIRWLLLRLLWGLPGLSISYLLGHRRSWLPGLRLRRGLLYSCLLGRALGRRSSAFLPLLLPLLILHLFLCSLSQHQLLLAELLVLLKEPLHGPVCLSYNSYQEDHQASEEYDQSGHKPYPSGSKSLSSPWCVTG